MNEKIYEKTVIRSQAEEIERLKKENKNSQERIEKAISYIEWQMNNPQYDNIWRKQECESLIKILKGEE